MDTKQIHSRKVSYPRRRPQDKDVNRKWSQDHDEVEWGMKQGCKPLPKGWVKEQELLWVILLRTAERWCRTQLKSLLLKGEEGHSTYPPAPPTSTDQPSCSEGGPPATIPRLRRGCRSCIRRLTPEGPWVGHTKWSQRGMMFPLISISVLFLSSLFSLFPVKVILFFHFLTQWALSITARMSEFEHLGVLIFFPLCKTTLPCDCKLTMGLNYVTCVSLISNLCNLCMNECTVF